MFKFKINNKEWTIAETNQQTIRKIITEKNEKPSETGKYFGITYMDTHQIFLDKDLCADRKKLTLYHELAHCYICSFMTHEMQNYDEEMVADIVSNSHELIHQIVCDYFDSRSEKRMGLHSKSNKETRKRKYADQFARTSENKRKRIEKDKKKSKKN